MHTCIGEDVLWVDDDDDDDAVTRVHASHENMDLKIGFLT
jgi:hypothetical protein